jgi:hypothetical protein
MPSDIGKAQQIVADAMHGAEKNKAKIRGAMRYAAADMGVPELGEAPATKQNLKQLFEASQALYGSSPSPKKEVKVRIWRNPFAK